MRQGKSYRIANKGTYTVFRETRSLEAGDAEHVVLIVGFRLRLIRNNGLMHWLFQRICILTTPLWSGFEGFSIKLWMVDHSSKNYLGIYDWAGRKQALTYVHTLTRVLNFFSVKDSVWHKISTQSFEDYLRRRAG